MPTTPSTTRRTFLVQSAAALAASRSRFGLASTPTRNAVPQPAPFGSVRASGDLGRRTAQNFARLQEPLYRPPQIFRGTNWQAWPGDMEGRALLAVTLLSRATGTEPDYFPAMVAAYPAQLNASGYFGPTLDLAAIDEQQLSGHGWFLRGLCEYYDFTRATPEGDRTLAQIRTVIRNLALPLRGSYATYPIDPAAHTRSGGVNGRAAGLHGVWVVSTDTCCAFIFLDGLTQAWVVLQAAGAPEAPALKSLVDEAIDRFSQVDLVAIQAQTHATLTALRAIMRVYEATQSPRLLDLVKNRYLLYRTSAMTEHYANINWFGRPDSWTEPCAIIDSFILATQLWQHTGEPSYLEDAHRIWANGVGRGLRGNGGFGTDTCPSLANPILRVRSYEAFFCCTMRGGEGHARAIQNLYFTQPATSTAPATLTVPFYADSQAELDLGHARMQVRQTTSYPHSGPTRIDFSGTFQPTRVVVRLFAPHWTSNHTTALNGRPIRTVLEHGFLTARLTLKPGDTLLLQHTLTVGPRPAFTAGGGPNGYVYESGPLVLGHDPLLQGGMTPPIRMARSLQPSEIPGTYRIEGRDELLSPIDDLSTLVPRPTPKDPCPRQILFRES